MGFFLGPLSLLRRAHPTLPTQLGLAEGVDEVALGSDHEIQVEGVVLAEGEALEAIDDDRFVGSILRTMRLENQQGVPAEAGGVGHDGGGRAVQEARDLAEARSGEQTLTDGVKKFGTTQPVVGLEGLLTEGATAM